MDTTEGSQGPAEPLPLRRLGRVWAPCPLAEPPRPVPNSRHGPSLCSGSLSLVHSCNINNFLPSLAANSILKCLFHYKINVIIETVGRWEHCPLTPPQKCSFPSCQKYEQPQLSAQPIFWTRPQAERAAPPGVTLPRWGQPHPARTQSGPQGPFSPQDLSKASVCLQCSSTAPCPSPPPSCPRSC